MIRIGVVLLCLLTGFQAMAQRDLTMRSKKKSTAFGEMDFNEYIPHGLQVSIGPNLMWHYKPRVENFTTHGAYSNEVTTSRGILPGFNAEIGMLHLPKRSTLSKKLGYIFINYIDWGVGIKFLGGTETTRIDYLDDLGNEYASDSDKGRFYNPYVYGHVTVHKLFYIGKKYFIDNGFGINVNYNLNKKTDEDYTDFVANQANKTHYFHHPLVAHVHYELGFGIRLNRRSMFVISAQTPIFGINEWRKGGSAMKWFDSNYVPLVFKLKYTYLFQKKNKNGCTPAKVSDTPGQ